MKAFRRFHSEHKDFIHDVQFDFYGKRLATCSSDQKIKVWDHDKEGKWYCAAEIKGHSGSVHKLSWAHPEFGQVLASCTSEGAVYIYDEETDARTGKQVWKQKGHLVDSRDEIRDVKFAPRHLGLQLATASVDGRVRIYVAQDVMNLSVWQITEEVEAAERNAFCVSWNPSPFDSPMLAIGTESSVQIREFSGKFNKWVVAAELEGLKTVHDVAWAPNMGRSFHLIATASKDGFVRVYKLFLNATATGGAAAAAGASAAGSASAGGAAGDESKGAADVSYKTECVAKLGHHKAEVWRVAWNVTGTMLASTGDDGTARLWKSDFYGKWHPTLVAGPPGGGGASA